MVLFQKYYKNFREKGMQVVPDKFGEKSLALKGITTSIYEKYTDDEVFRWLSELGDRKTNIALVCGPASGVISLDLDSDKPEVLEVIEHLLPESPVEKRGAKGYTRFFKYSGEQSEMLKYNGEVVLEILSIGKKTTLPPSRHPSGADYVYTQGDLLDIDVSTLPVLPPALITTLQLKLQAVLGAETAKYGRVINGRNQALSKELGVLLEKESDLSKILNAIIKIDEETNDPPYFTDPSENKHTDATSNALVFISSHLNSINSRRFREGKDYLSPKIVDAGVVVEGELSGKKEKAVLQKKLLSESLLVDTALKRVYETILKNSWIPQPELALSASLSLFSVLAGRNFTFQGVAPNLYCLNVSKSGTGKDYVQQFIKDTLLDINADTLIGAGDYVSDASLMDGLPLAPVRLDILDEAGGILKSVTSGRSEYNSKMADILAELYTSSTSKFLGRRTAEGIKGAVTRPSVSILASTTPTGLREGVTRTAIDKGLLGRFLIFEGEPSIPAKRVKNISKIDPETRQHLLFLRSYKPKESVIEVGGNQQAVTELTSTPEADALLDKIFDEFDTLRRKATADVAHPIISRLYQQMIKLVIIHTIGRGKRSIPSIDTEDVLFGYNMIMGYYSNINSIVTDLIFSSSEEKDRHKVLSIIEFNGVIDRQKLILSTPELNRMKRDNIISELIDAGLVDTTYINKEGKQMVHYFKVGETNV